MPIFGQSDGKRFKQDVRRELCGIAYNKPDRYIDPFKPIRAENNELMNKTPKTAAIKKWNIFHTLKLETYAAFLIALYSSFSIPQ